MKSQAMQMSLPTKDTITLTRARVLYQIFKWRRDGKRFELHNIEDCLVCMLEEMDEQGEPKYILSAKLAREGVPTLYKEVFIDSCEKGYITWRKSRFMMKMCLFRNFE